jgi:hypothetical protein
VRGAREIARRLRLPAACARLLQLEDADDVLEELEEALIVSGALRALT